MKESKQKLVIDGNSFYELDLQCVEQKEKTAQCSPKISKPSSTHFGENRQKSPRHK